MLLYTFLVTSFDQFKEYMISRILFSKFLDVIHGFTCASSIGNPLNNCLNVNIFIPSPGNGFYLASEALVE